MNFDLQAEPLDGERRAQFPGRVGIARRGIGADIEIAEPPGFLQRFVDGAEPGFGVARRHQRVLRRHAGMERLGHGAELYLRAGRMAEADAERALNAVRVKPHQPRRGAGGADDTDGAGGVPTLFVMRDVDAGADYHHRLQPGDIGVENGPAAGTAFLAQRQQGRCQHRRRVAAIAVVVVVEIERMGGGAVDQRGVRRGHAPGAADHRRGPAAEVVDGGENALCRHIGTAGDHAADNIDHGVARQLQGPALGQRFARRHPCRERG